MISATIQDDAARRELARIQRLLDDMTPLMDVLGQATLTRVDLAFRGEHDFYGTPWQPLSAYTLNQRRLNGRGARILRDTGVLAASFHAVVGPKSADVGTDVSYAETHQFGAPNPNPRFRDIPARPMLPLASVGLPQDFEDEIQQDIRTYLGI